MDEKHSKDALSRIEDKLEHIDDRLDQVAVSLSKHNVLIKEEYKININNSKIFDYIKTHVPKVEKGLALLSSSLKLTLGFAGLISAYHILKNFFTR